MAHKHKWQRRSTTIEDSGRGITATVTWYCAGCKGFRTSSKTIRPPSPTAKAWTTPAAADAVPQDDAAAALEALGFKAAEIPELLLGTTGTTGSTQERIAAALQRNGATH